MRLLGALRLRLWAAGASAGFCAGAFGAALGAALGAGGAGGACANAPEPINAVSIVAAADTANARATGRAGPKTNR